MIRLRKRLFFSNCKSFVVISISCCLLAITNTNVAKAGYNFPDEAFSTTVDNYSSSLSESHAGPEENSSFVQASIIPNSVTGKGGANFACVNFDDPRCAGKDWMLGKLILAPCTLTRETFCIDTLTLGSISEGKFNSLTSSGMINTKTIAASPESGVPGGSSASLWKDPQHGEFLVVATLNYYKNKNESVKFSDLSARVVPISVVKGLDYVGSTYFDYGVIDGMQNAGWKTTSQLKYNQTDCYIATDGICYVKKDFQEELDVSLSLKVPGELKGWLFGRMKNSEVSLKPIDKNSAQLTVSGKTAKVPNLNMTMTKAELFNYKKFVDWAKANGYNSGEDIFKKLRLPGSSGTSGGLVDAFWSIDMWGDLLKAYSGPDKLFAQNTAWNFGTIQSASVNSACTSGRNKFLGMVTTNAPIYESNPPLYKNGQLQYRVAGPHFDSDQKTLFKGVYDLNIDSEFARCIYGFTAAPISATISVTNADGTSQDIATEVMSEKNGWIHLGAYNFHFSSPTVRVKFTQASKATNSTGNLNSIICARGFIKKKIAGTKCPTGFKKVN